jgi:hypothetical protein
MIILRYTSESPSIEKSSYDWVTKKTHDGLCGYDVTASVSDFKTDGYTFEEAIAKTAKTQANFDNSHVDGGEFVVFEGRIVGTDPHGNPCFDGKNAVIATYRNIIATGKLVAPAEGGYFIDYIDFK